MKKTLSLDQHNFPSHRVSYDVTDGVQAGGDLLFFNKDNDQIGAPNCSDATAPYYY